MFGYEAHVLADDALSVTRPPGDSGGDFGEVALGHCEMLSISGLCLLGPPQLSAMERARGRLRLPPLLRGADSERRIGGVGSLSPTLRSDRRACLKLPIASHQPERHARGRHSQDDEPWPKSPACTKVGFAARMRYAGFARASTSPKCKPGTSVSSLPAVMHTKAPSCQKTLMVSGILKSVLFQMTGHNENNHRNRV